MISIPWGRASVAVGVKDRSRSKFEFPSFTT